MTPATRARRTCRRTFPTAEAGVVYSPRNYDGRYRGPLLARRALAGSENVPAVALASRARRARTLLRFLRRAGFTDLRQAPPRTTASASRSATPKSGSTSWSPPTPRSRAAASGSRRRWRLRRRAAGRRTAQLVSPRTAFWITDILSRRRGARVHLRPRRQPRVPVSRRGEDRHVAGVSRQLDGRLHARRDRRRLGRQLRSLAAARLVRRDRRRADLPRGDAGRAAPRRRHRATPSPMRRWPRRPMASSIARSARCPACRPTHGARRSAASTCPAETDTAPCSWHHQAEQTGSITEWPAGYREWARSAGLASPAWPQRRRSSSDTRASASGSRPALAIASPPSGATYLIDPTLRRDFQTLPLRAVTEPTGRLEWHVDGRSSGSPRPSRLWRGRWRRASTRSS